MADLTNPTPSDELLDAVVDYALRHGLAEMSLRSLAKELGVSTYKFSYRFGSKDQLMAAIVAEIERRQRDEMRSWVTDGETWTLGSLLRRYWSWCVQPKSQQFLRLLFDIRVAALRCPEELGIVSSELQDAMRYAEEMCCLAGVRAEDVKIFATNMAAYVRGLQLDLLSTDDVERTTEALNAYANQLDQMIADQQRSPQKQISTRKQPKQL